MGLEKISSWWDMARDKRVGEPGWLISGKADVPSAASSAQVSGDLFTHLCIISWRQLWEQGSDTCVGSYSLTP